jgi:hypothetical protein
VKARQRKLRHNYRPALSALVELPELPALTVANSMLMLDPAHFHVRLERLRNGT